MVEQQPFPVVSSGSSPTSPLQLTKTPVVRELTPREANSMLEKWHYLGKCPAIIFAVGHEEGCCVFSTPRSRIMQQKYKPSKLIELVRMVGKPGHTFAMTSLMSVAAKFAKNKGWDVIVTYSDPYAGHTGNVYRAAGYEDVGLVCKDGHPLIFLDGKLTAPKTFYGRHGTQSIPKLKEIYGDRLLTQPKPLKSKFIKWLTKQKESVTICLESKEPSSCITVNNMQVVEGIIRDAPVVQETI